MLRQKELHWMYKLPCVNISSDETSKFPFTSASIASISSALSDVVTVFVTSMVAISPIIEGIALGILVIGWAIGWFVGLRKMGTSLEYLTMKNRWEIEKSDDIWKKTSFVQINCLIFETNWILQSFMKLEQFWSNFWGDFILFFLTKAYPFHFS